LRPAAFAAVIILAIFGVYMARSATPVSAQQILERASSAQSATGPTQGIRHMRVETYNNFQLLSGDQSGTLTLAESYVDFATDNFRRVTTDPATGQVLDAFAYDGAYTLSSRYPPTAATRAALPVYHIPQPSNRVAKEPYGDPSDSAKQMLDQVRSDPAMKLQVKQTGRDGREVYVLSGEHPVKALVGKDVKVQTGSTTMVFDVQTYQFLESRSTIQKDGKEFLVNSTKYLTNEILPAGSSVAWDLSDVKGISMVDDPNGEHGDALPEIISTQELAAHAQAYLFSSVPEGFTLEITSPPFQPKDQPFVYVINYRNTAGDYIVIPSSDVPDSLCQSDFNDESYTTASGLVVQFGKAAAFPDGKQETPALVTVPNGTRFLLNSTLPRERIKSLAESLAPVR
jgi:hypothetical protein